MSEESKPQAQLPAPAAAAEPAAASGSRSVLASALAVVALLVALGTVVGGYFVWHEVQRLGAWQQQVLGQLDMRNQTLEQRLQGFKDRLDADLAAAERSRRSLEEAQRTLRDAQQGLDEALAGLRARLGNSAQDWTLAEVQYLLQVANQRLQFLRDPGTAAAALATADRRLQSLGDPGFNAVRAEIANELSALQAVTEPDLSGIVLTLESLARQVDTLPLKDAPTREAPDLPADAPADAASPSAMDDWRRLPAEIWAELRRLVVVRRNETPVGAMLAPEQAFFLRENVRLQLGSARLAALQSEPAGYRASLRMADGWLAEHFADESAQVAAVRGELQRLAGLDIRPALPEISGSLRLLRQQMQQTGAGEPAAATGTPQ